MNATIINKFGKLTGWNELTVHFLGRDIEGITEFEYDDEVDMNYEYGAGGFPVGLSEGNYKAKGSITLLVEEIVSIHASLPAGSRIQQIPAFPVFAVYELNGFVVKDIVQNCKIKNVGKAVKNGEGKMVQKLDLVLSHIDWHAQ